MAGAHPEYTVFHSTAWARVLMRTYGHRPLYLRVRRGGEPALLLPLMEVRSWLTGRRGVSLPFSDQCGALVFGEFEAAALLAELSRMAKERGWKYFEVRGGPPLRDTAGEAPSFFSHTLDLRASENELLDGCDGAVRRAIRKAERSGVRAEMKRDGGAMETYYRLHVQTRRKHGLPPQPWKFFRNLHEEIVAPGDGFVVLAHREGRPLAASIFFQAGTHATYKFGASDETQQEFRGSNLVMWEGIRALKHAGAVTLDFGRTSVSNDGLRRFKHSWGTTERPQHYFRRTASNGAWAAPKDRTGGGHNAIFRRSPHWANRAMGAFLYRHLD